MPITAQCPHCQRSYHLPDQQAGKNAKCKCGNTFTIRLPEVELEELEELDDELSLAPLPPAPTPMPTMQPLAGFQQPALQQPAFQQPAFQQGGASSPGISANGLWRAGRLLVMQTGTFLPQHVCIKTGEAAVTTKTVKLTWAPAWVHLTIVLGRLMHYAIVASHGREATVKVGLGSAANLKRNVALFGGYGLVALGFLSFIGFGVLIVAQHQEGDPYPVWPIFVGGMFIGLGALFAHFGSQLISAVGINNRFIVIRGVSRRVLDSLPEWQGAVPQGASK